MVEVSLNEWKQFTEGLSRKRFGPFTQHNVVNGPDCFRIYKDGEEIVASMKVEESNTDRLGQECIRVFYIKEELLELIRDIYIPTQEDWDEWDEFRDEDDEEWLREKGIIE